MTSTANEASSEREVRPARITLRLGAILEILATGIHYAIVRIVPVVSELLNLTESDSPSCNVSPPAP